MECNRVLPTTKFAYRKGLGTCDALLCVSHTLQSALESGQEARMLISLLEMISLLEIFSLLEMIELSGRQLWTV